MLSLREFLYSHCINAAELGLMTQEYGGIALLQYRRIPCTECTAALALFIISAKQHDGA